MSPPVLDASAVLALLNGEPGAAEVAKAIPGALLSAVNLAEVVSKLVDHGVADAAARAALAGLGIRIVDFDEALAHRVGALRRETRHVGLALGDRACLAVGQELERTVLTADRRWAELDLAIDIRVIR